MSRLPVTTPCGCFHIAEGESENAQQEINIWDVMGSLSAAHSVNPGGYFLSSTTECETVRGIVDHLNRRKEPGEMEPLASYPLKLFIQNHTSTSGSLRRVADHGASPAVGAEGNSRHVVIQA